MPHATRCPACRTGFRVTPAQLQASDGWVRCGQCDTVFDARLHLRETAAADRAGPAAQAAGPAPASPRGGEPPEAPWPAPAPGAVDREPPFVLTGLLRTRSGRPLDATASEPLRYTPAGMDAAPHPAAYRHGAARSPNPPTPQPQPVPVPEATTPAAPAAGPADDADRPPAPGPAPRFPRADARPASAPAWSPPDGDIPSALLLHTADSDVPQDQLYDPAFAAPALPPAGSADAAVDEDPALQRLSFVREARRRAFWSRTPVRAGVAVAGLLLLAALALQVAHHERDRLAARLPGARPALAAMCRALGCAIAPLRQIEAVALDNARFGRLGPGRYSLALGMRNGAATGVATPSAELTLSDAQGRVVLRRVLVPQDLGAPAVLAAGDDWNGALALSMPDEAPGAAVSDYGLLLFYP